MTAEQLRQRVASRMATPPTEAGQRQRAIRAMLRGRAAVGGPPGQRR